MKKTLLTGVALCVLAGCVNPTQTQTAPKTEQKQASQKITIGYNQLPANIDPAADYNGWFTVRYGSGETLFKLNDKLEPEPWLAKSIEQTSQLEWTVTLKDNVTFQNGEKMTAEKVKASLERLLEKNERAKGDLTIENITAKDNQVVIKTTQEVPIMANLLSEPYACIVDTTGKLDTDKALVGTGPYIVTSYTAESGVELKAYDQYWNGKPKTNQISIKYFTDANALSLALQSKEIDAAFGIAYANLGSYRSNADYTISEVGGTRFVNFMYNFDKPLIADAKFRQALDTLVDKETYTKSLFAGSAEVAKSAFTENLGFAIHTSVHEYNVEKAKALLDEAGYKDTNNDGIREKDGKNINLELLSYNRLAEIPLAMQAFQQQLKEVGIDSTIKTVEKIGPALKENTYDVSPYTMVGAPIGDAYSYFLGSVASDGVVNVGHYKNEQVDAKIKELATTVGLEKRNALSQEIEALIDKDYAFTYIGHFKVAFVMGKDVKGLVSHPTDYYHVTNELVKE
ncbi:ABC transporter substrate-binding protein [Carnobacteriaceae bacterium zg-ZUI78]|nr:ABC transporter substrate-binding protein [Carnobacteriaceae bacterium zg-ZUI78]